MWIYQHYIDKRVLEFASVDLNPIQTNCCDRVPYRMPPSPMDTPQVHLIQFP